MQISQINSYETISCNSNSDRSIINKIISSIIFRVRRIATCIENFAWRFVDPNWNHFVVKGRGHFVKSKYRDRFNAALIKMNKIFKANIGDRNDVKKWLLTYNNINFPDNNNQIWSQFSKQYGGTCFGNCVSLANSIIKSGKFLAIDELKEIEESNSLVVKSQAIQLVANSVVEYNKTIVSKSLEKSSLSALGLTIEEYQKYEQESQSKIDLLIREGVTKNDLRTPLEELLNLDSGNFAFTLLSLIKNAKKRCMIHPGLGLIKQFNLLPLEKMEEICTIQRANFKNAEIFSSITPDFKGIVLINGISVDEKNGHAMLLEVDSENNTYIFYDNNRGYYRWNDLQSCLSGIETRLEGEYYGSCEVMLSTL